MANKSIAPLVEFLLSRHVGNTMTPKPNWVDNILVPGENALRETIRKEKQALDEHQQQLLRKEESKNLLYETGIPLEDVVKSIFVSLGALIEPSVVTDEFVINVAGKRVLAEVKGNTKSISKGDVAQLNIDTEVHFKKTNEKIDGILIGNGFRLLPIDERNTNDKPVFPNNVIEIAKASDIGLLSTISLFNAYCQLIENPTRKLEILNKVINGHGLITF